MDTFLETVEQEKTGASRNSSLYRKLKLKYRGAASEGNRYIRNVQL